MSGAGGGLVSLSSAGHVERAVGVKYRREVSDLGLGLAMDGMQPKLRSWGYEVTPGHCLQWLRLYRMGDTAKDSGAAVFEVSRVQLTWKGCGGGLCRTSIGRNVECIRRRSRSSNGSARQLSS